MTMKMSRGQGVPFYDPFYRVNTNKVATCDVYYSRFYDDFNVFDSVHILKPQILSLNIPSRPAVYIVSECPATDQGTQGQVTTGTAMLSTLEKAVDDDKVGSSLPVSGAEKESVETS